METTIRAYLEKVTFVKENLYNKTHLIIVENEAEILDLNRKSLNEGKKPDGSIFDGYKHKYDGFSGYDGFYSFPKEKNKTFNFNWTGDYFRSLKINFENEAKISIISNDSKKGLLLKAYGETAGLNAENQRILNYQIILPELMKFINQHI